MKKLTTKQIHKMLEESILASYEKALEQQAQEQVLSKEALQNPTAKGSIEEFEKWAAATPELSLTDAFGFPVTKRTRTRAAQEGYDVVVVRGVAYFVDTQDHLAICE